MNMKVTKISNIFFLKTIILGVFSRNPQIHPSKSPNSTEFACPLSHVTTIFFEHKQPLRPIARMRINAVCSHGSRSSGAGVVLCVQDGHSRRKPRARYEVSPRPTATHGRQSCSRWHTRCSAALHPRAWRL